MADRRTQEQLLAIFDMLIEDCKIWRKGCFNENEKKREALKKLKNAQQELEEQKQTILKLRREVEALQTDKADLIQIGNRMIEDLRLFAQEMREPVVVS